MSVSSTRMLDPSFSENPDLAFDAIECLAQPENQIQVARESGLPPVREDRSANQGAANQGEAPWAGRAEVRPPRPSDYGDTDWSTAAAPSEPGAQPPTEPAKPEGPGAAQSSGRLWIPGQ